MWVIFDTSVPKGRPYGSHLQALVAQGDAHFSLCDPKPGWGTSCHRGCELNAVKPELLPKETECESPIPSLPHPCLKYSHLTLSTPCHPPHTVLLREKITYPCFTSIHLHSDCTFRVKKNQQSLTCVKRPGNLRQLLCQFTV